MKFGHKRTNRDIETTSATRRPLRAVILALDPGKPADEARALELARELAAGPLQANVLVVSRSMRTDSLPITSRIDWLTLPTLSGPPILPSSADREARSINGTEEIAVTEDPVAAYALRGALQAFAPEIVVVDDSQAGVQALANMEVAERPLQFSYAEAQQTLTDRGLQAPTTTTISPAACARTRGPVRATLTASPA